MKNLIIVGHGPAGISAALYAKRAGVEVSIISKNESALKKASMIENYYGFENGISGPELLEKGIEQAKALGVNILEGEVVGLSFDDKLTVLTTNGEKKADAVLLATGSQRKVPKIKGINEFEGKGVSYCAVCDGFFFRNKPVVVLGKGEYANHEAGVLKPLASKVEILEDIESVNGEDQVESVTLKTGENLEVSGVFVAYGVAGSGDLARKIGAQVKGSNIVVNDQMQTNIPGLYAAGDCTGGLLQIGKAVYEGSVAGMAIAKELKKGSKK